MATIPAGLPLHLLLLRLAVTFCRGLVILVVRFIIHLLTFYVLPPCQHSRCSSAFPLRLPASTRAAHLWRMFSAFCAHTTSNYIFLPLAGCTHTTPTHCCHTHTHHTHAHAHTTTHTPYSHPTHCLHTHVYLTPYHPFTTSLLMGQFSFSVAACCSHCHPLLSLTSVYLPCSSHPKIFALFFPLGLQFNSSSVHGLGFLFFMGLLNASSCLTHACDGRTLACGQGLPGLNIQSILDQDTHDREVGES